MAVLLPREIQNDSTLYTYNESLKALRARFEQAVADMESGSYSIKKLFSSIIDEMVSLLDSMTSAIEAVVIPKESFSDFQAGTVYMDEFASFDMMKYYNGLKRMRHIIYGLNVALILLQDIPVKPITPAKILEQGIMDVLDSREFIEQGAENPVFEAQQSFIYYTIVGGDTLPSIAAKVFDGDSSRWPEIAQLNSLSDSDLLDTDMVGTNIKIPTNAISTNNFQSNNLVFEKFYDGTDQKKIDRYLYGRDLELFQGKLQISATGDLKRMEGTKCVVDNIKNRFKNTQGALNPLNVDWGLLSLSDNNDVPFAIFLDRLITNMEYQAMSDGRVITAAGLRKTIILKGDELNVDMELGLLGRKKVRNVFSARSL